MFKLCFELMYHLIANVKAFKIVITQVIDFHGKLHCVRYSSIVVDEKYLYATMWDSVETVTFGDNLISL